MVVYMDLVVILNFLVDFLLLLGTNRLAGYQSRLGRVFVSALLGGLYGGACMLPRFSFLGNTFFRTASLAAMGILAFGRSRSAVRRCVLFLLLSMALGGVALGMGKGNFFTILVAAGAVLLLSIFSFRGKLGKRFVPVEIAYAGKTVKLNALCDTGNTLRDPLSGQEILVIEAQAAKALTGLTDAQLKNPACAIGTIPGLRLVPYRAVGVKGGMLLGKKFEKVKIGNLEGSRLVAFAPEGLSANEEYQALLGGAV